MKIRDDWNSKKYIPTNVDRSFIFDLERYSFDTTDLSVAMDMALSDCGRR